MLPNSCNRILIPVCRSNNIRNFSISRMLDLGGAPTDHSSSNKAPVRTVNASKNSKVRAVCFDFTVVTMTVQESKNGLGKKAVATSSSSNHDARSSSTIQPDMRAVQEVAKLLNVDFNSNTNEASASKSRLSPKEQRDLDRLMGEQERVDTNQDESAVAKKDFHPLDNDIRFKYAKKLQQKGVSGYSPHAQQDSTSRNDASDHLAARAAVMADSTNITGNKWMAQTGTGSLLQYLTQRSIYIALLPEPDTNAESATTLASMQAFQKQLQSTVIIDVLLQRTETENNTATLLLQESLKQLDLSQEPSKVLIVSNKDNYLKAAKDLGCISCRIHQPGTPRGNVSAQYTVESIPDVRTVVDEMNGISFSALFTTSKR